MARAALVSDLGDHELLDELARHRKELFTLRFKLATGSLENTSKIPQEKRTIARILTELREREIAAAEANQKEANG
ncbi:MAG: 50S ribosomal protein L29 [Microthrixaceae bacterium]